MRKKERREKEIKRQEGGDVDLKGKNKEKESRRSSEERKRTPLTEVFPDIQGDSPAPIHRRQLPVVTVETATADGHSAPDDCVSIMEEDEEIYDGQREPPVETPVKKARARPLSGQQLGRSKPKGMYEGEDGMFSTHVFVTYLFIVTLGVLSILDAATNDLAQLINHLGLEAIPGTPDMILLKPTRDFLSSIQKRNGSPGQNNDDSPNKGEIALMSFQKAL